MKYLLGLAIVGMFAGFAAAEDYKVEKSTTTIVKITKTSISGDTKTIVEREVQAADEVAAIDKVIEDLDGQIVNLQAQKTKLEAKKQAVLDAVKAAE